MSQTPAASISPASVPRLALEAAIAFALALMLTLIATRQGRQLGHDGYYYVELAKRFSTEWPDRFGNDWPFGWPLGGGLLARMGIPAYFALAGLSAVTLAGLLACAAAVLRAHPLRLAVLVAIGAAPVVAPEISGCLTELPFAAILLGLAVCLAHWTNRWAIWLAAWLIVKGLSIRYVGLIALPAAAFYLADQWRSLREAGRLRPALFAIALAGLVCAALLGSNVVVSGHVSGADRGVPEGFGAFPREVANFGWSAPAALISGALLHSRFGPGTRAGWIVGAAAFSLIVGLCGWSWFRPASRYSKALALLALAYCAGMAFLRCIGNFDEIYGARTFLPALPPLVLLCAEKLGRSRLLLAGICAGAVACGMLAAVRGISREIAGDVRPAVAALAGKVGPADRIGVNENAFSVSAYFRQPVDRIGPSYGEGQGPDAFIVLAGRPSGRAGAPAPLSRDWTDAVGRLTSAGHYRFLSNTPALVVLERTPSSRWSARRFSRLPATTP